MEPSTEKYKILHIDTEKRIGGGEKQLRLLVDSLPPNFESIIAIRKESETENLFKNRENVIKVPFSSGVDIPTLSALIRVVKQYSIDLIHAHTGMAANYALLLKPFVKAIVATRRVSIQPRFTAKAKYRFFDRVVAVSRSILKQLSFLKIEQLVWIESALDERFVTCPSRDEALAILKLDSEYDYICSVGKIGEMKAQDLLLEAFAEVNVERLKLIIAGAGELEQLKRDAERLGIKDKVVFTGYLEDPRPVYSASRFLVVPSRYGEGSQGVIKEALACSIPVIATNIGSAPYIIAKNGILIPPNNKEALKKAIIEMLSKTIEVNFDRELYSPCRMAAEYARLYSELLLKNLRTHTFRI